MDSSGCGMEGGRARRGVEKEEGAQQIWWIDVFIRT